MGNSPLQQISILEGALAETEAKLKEAEQARFEAVTIADMLYNCMLITPETAPVLKRARECLQRIRGDVKPSCSCGTGSGQHEPGCETERGERG